MKHLAFTKKLKAFSPSQLAYFRNWRNIRDVAYFFFSNVSLITNAPYRDCFTLTTYFKALQMLKLNFSNFNLTNSKLLSLKYQLTDNSIPTERIKLHSSLIISTIRNPLEILLDQIYALQLPFLFNQQNCEFTLLCKKLQLYI